MNPTGPAEQYATTELSVAVGDGANEIVSDNSATGARTSGARTSGARTSGELADDAVALAARLLTTSIADATATERRRQRRMHRLLGDTQSRELMFALTDEVLRVGDPEVAARLFRSTVAAHNSRALGTVDNWLLTVGGRLATRLPRLVMPLVQRRIKAETRGIVISADDPEFADHIRKRRAEGVRLNVNPLGEAILSDEEADERMRMLCQRIERRDVDYVSVKISSIVANLSALAFEDSVDRVSERLRELYRRAEAATPRTFVNLDMEEYRDLDLTLDSFIGVLSEPEFGGIDAGIVLQAYLPDAHAALDRLGSWARQRRDDPKLGGRVKVRLVKGANLAMEKVEAELHGWTAAPYGSKADVDASYKRMLASALRPEWNDALRVGVASHNLFDVAWALVTTGDNAALDGGQVEFEMLEGMAPAQARAVADQTGGLLMYAPVVTDRDFEASIAYLSRRLDENTQPENFLRVLFDLTPGSDEFAEQAERFRQAVAESSEVSTARRRRPGTPTQTDETGRFSNEPDQDWTDADTRAAVLTQLGAVPAVSIDRFETTARIDDAVARLSSTSTPSLASRRAWLRAAAEIMRSERNATIALMADEVAKTITEGDPEVSEAIDFCEYYARIGIDELQGAVDRGLEVTERGVVAVVGPWNFPYAIPVGGVAASIAAGNRVLLKPAPEAVRVGTWIVDQFRRAGVPDNVLDVVVCPDNEVGTRLVTHPGVDMVVLTGSYETAARFLEWKPTMRLFAETSGKNSLVITATADLDLAIADLVRSAFGHAGQKCSAASLGIIEASVYDDATFMRRLADAVSSLRVRHADDPASMVGPLVSAPTDKLYRALTSLEPGESWLVEPRSLDDTNRLWSPGVRTGVSPGSWFHQTECFGPVLGLIRADDLDDAIRIQNDTQFGLTGGIWALEQSEIDRWLEGVEVGNAYINRHITGAIVQRQPFGGWKRSSVGGGAKAGGTEYVHQFARLTGPADTAAAERSYTQAWDQRYGVAHDPTALSCESNVVRYVPLPAVLVRHDDTSGELVAMARLAARTAGVTLVESDTATETDADFIERAGSIGWVRLLVPVGDDTLDRLHRAGVTVTDDPITADGIVELRHWVRAQSISTTLHRHGRPVDFSPIEPTRHPSPS